MFHSNFDKHRRFLIRPTLSTFVRFQSYVKKTITVIKSTNLHVDAEELVFESRLFVARDEDLSCLLFGVPVTTGDDLMIDFQVHFTSSQKSVSASDAWFPDILEWINADEKVSFDDWFDMNGEANCTIDAA